MNVSEIDIRLFAKVESLLQELDKAQFHEYVGISTLLWVKYRVNARKGVLQWDTYLNSLIDSCSDRHGQILAWYRRIRFDLNRLYLDWVLLSTLDPGQSKK